MGRRRLALSHVCNMRVQRGTARLGMPRPWSSLVEERLDLLDSLPGCFGIADERLNCSAEAQHAEDDEQLPTDVLEARRDKQTDGEIEEPVTESRNTLDERSASRQHGT